MPHRQRSCTSSCEESEISISSNIGLAWMQPLDGPKIILSGSVHKEKKAAAFQNIREGLCAMFFPYKMVHDTCRLNGKT